MTATLAALLRAVCENPADDDVRMILADWLDDNGQAERAEFVRVQVRLASFGPRSAAVLYHEQQSQRGLKCDAIGCNYCKLRDREAELFKQYPAWVPEVILQDVACAGLAFQLTETPTPEGYVGGVWRRGFISSIVCELGGWMKHGPAIVGCQPVEAVVLADREPVGPLWATVNGVYRQTWSWDRNEQAGGHAENVPAILFDLLRGGTLVRGVRVMAYGDPESAHADLSRAAVLLARSLAGLPPPP